MNLVDHQATPISRALELARLEAARYGLAVHSTEIVGLVPQAAIAESSSFYLQLHGFDPDRQILENLVARADAARSPARASAPPVPEAPPGIRGQRVQEFLAALASPEPTPGGGSMAAVAGAAGG